MGKAGVILVVGHASETGGENYNQKLGMRRAKQVAAALRDAKVAASRIVCVSLGQKFPLSRGNTAEDHQRNRRVEVFLVPGKGELDA